MKKVEENSKLDPETEDAKHTRILRNKQENGISKTDLGCLNYVDCWLLRSIHQTEQQKRKLFSSKHLRENYPKIKWIDECLHTPFTRNRFLFHWMLHLIRFKRILADFDKKTI